MNLTNRCKIAFRPQLAQLVSNCFCQAKYCVSSKAVFLNMGRSKFLGGNYKIANENHCLNNFFRTQIFHATEKA